MMAYGKAKIKNFNINTESKNMKYWSIIVLWSLAASAVAQDYSTCETWDELVGGKEFKYAPLVRMSDPGTKEQPAYTGFWFYDEHQFDIAGRYALGMKVHFQNRDVEPADRGDIGYIDLHNGFKWTKIGETTAWNWQQGNRLQWRPNSDEILWNDRSEDGTHFICRAYNFKTGARRTLPRSIYDVSSDGTVALTHDFTRMKHGGTMLVGIPDPYEDQRAPAQSGIEKMNMETGEVEFLISLERIAKLAFPKGYTGETNLYFFREGWNPSGTRFITFLRNMANPRHVSGWSVSADGWDVRYFYNQPSHHTWQDDSTILEGRSLRLFKDDGSGKVAQQLVEINANPDPTILPDPYGDWVLGDTYVRNGVQHLWLFHRPSKLFVPLARLKSTAEGGYHRVDLHARCSRDGRIVSIDATHEGLGRQMYIANIGYILDNPPTGRAGAYDGGGDNDLSFSWTLSGSDGSWTNVTYADDDNMITKAECPSSGIGHYIEYTLGGAYTLTNARMNEDDNGIKEVDEWMLEYYDGSWKSAFGWTSSTSATWQEVDFSDVSGATKVRVHFKDNGTIQVEEVEVYGTNTGNRQ
ncbi:MAG: hypothetical protein OEW48_04855 [Phycisphaerae bacterium]|nr:hypothetical protein [Phycisphaerae bacterium]